MPQQFHRSYPKLLSLQLTCAEQVALWFLRRAASSGVASTVSGARHVFGFRRKRAAMQVIGNLANSIKHSPLKDSIVGSDYDLDVSPVEFDLLTAVAHAQRGGNVNELTRHWGWPAASDISALDHQITSFARHLSDSGRKLPDPWDRPVLASLEAATVTELDHREALLVDAVRQWVHKHLDEKDGFPPMLELLTAHGLDRLAMPLHTALHNSLMTATRQLVVHCPKCKKLSHDEARVLHAVSAMQRNHQGTVNTVLSSWLPPAAVRLTLPAIEGISRSLFDAGHRLPLRAWNLPEPNKSLELFDLEGWQPASEERRVALH